MGKGVCVCHGRFVLPEKAAHDLYLKLLWLVSSRPSGLLVSARVPKDAVTTGDKYMYFSAKNRGSNETVSKGDATICNAMHTRRASCISLSRLIKNPLSQDTSVQEEHGDGSLLLVQSPASRHSQSLQSSGIAH